MQRRRLIQKVEKPRVLAADRTGIILFIGLGVLVLHLAVTLAFTVAMYNTSDNTEELTTHANKLLTKVNNSAIIETVMDITQTVQELVHSPLVVETLLIVNGTLAVIGDLIAMNITGVAQHFTSDVNALLGRLEVLFAITGS